MTASIIILFTIVMVGILIKLSYHDIQEMEVPKLWIYIFNSCSIGFSMLLGSDRFVMAIITYALCALVGYVLYQKDAWGGADAQIIAGIGAYFTLSSSLAVYLMFLILGTFVIGRFMVKNKLKAVPYIPVMALSFIFTIGMMALFGGY
jgi:Flp pilus assembly protein protease CpaA